MQFQSQQSQKDARMEQRMLQEFKTRSFRLSRSCVPRRPVGHLLPGEAASPSIHAGLDLSAEVIKRLDAVK